MDSGLSGRRGGRILNGGALWEPGSSACSISEYTFDQTNNYTWNCVLFIRICESFHLSINR